MARRSGAVGVGAVRVVGAPSPNPGALFKAALANHPGVVWAGRQPPRQGAEGSGIVRQLVWARGALLEDAAVGDCKHAGLRGVSDVLEAHAESCWARCLARVAPPFVSGYGAVG
eukprot:2801749-Alexandrium_andersonii.AAC.1